MELTATAARKALQDSLHEDEEDEDEDEQRLLNLNEEEGDVWDEDSAYIEMLAKEVRRFSLPTFLSTRQKKKPTTMRVIGPAPSRGRRAQGA